MSTFRLSRRIPPILVDKGLLQSLEGYFRTQAASTFGVEKDDLSKAISVSIRDADGTEIFKSVDEFPPDKFPNSTRRVSLTLRPGLLSGLDVELELAPEMTDATLTIMITADGAREKAIGFADGVRRILLTRKTAVWVFHPHWIFDLTRGPFFGGAISLLVLALFTSHSTFIWLMIVSGLVLLPFYLASAIIFKPYVAFDTRRRELVDRVWNWFVLGAASFLLFGTAFVAFRQWILRLLGFE